MIPASAARRVFPIHAWKNREQVFHCVEQPSAEPKPQAKGEREVYSEAPRASSERAWRTERQNPAGRDSPAAAESRKNRLRDGFGCCGGSGALLIQRQQGGEEVGFGHVGLPAVGGEDGGVQLAVRVHKPSGFLVV